MVGKDRISSDPSFLLVGRNIDVIFLLYEGTPSVARTKISHIYDPLYLNVSVEIFSKSIEFIDLDVYKGRRFHLARYLHLKTHEKRLNKYYYLPFRSAHPLHSKNAFYF
ncbi:unnamed protein product [Discosporangium mesarthrocarpum]